MDVRVEAVVTRVEGTQAWVRVTGEEGGCGRCHEPGGCRTGMLNEVLGARCQEYAVLNGLAASAGSRVWVEVPDGLPLRAAGWAYGMPVLALLVGAAGGQLLGGELLSAAGAATGLLLAWWMIGRHGRQAAQAGWRPHLVEIIR